MPENKAITIYDIAQKAGVSIATVSRVFNNSTSVAEKTREKVLDVASTLGYHPQAFAQGLASKHKNVIMAVVPVISNYFFMEVLAGIQDRLSQHNYDLYIFNVSPDNLFNQVEHVLKRRWAAGYLFISIHLQDEEWKELKRYKTPITLVDEYFDDFDSVSVDSTKGAYTATSYLLRLGYRRLAMISASDISKPVQDRVVGFEQALDEHGLNPKEAVISKGDTRYRDGFTERNGYESMKIMLEQESPPEACFCCSDIQAIGAVKAMNDAGHRIPIISFDDIEVAEYVGLSTMRQPMYEMGFQATQKLIDRLKHRERTISHTIFSPELVVRSSTEHPEELDRGFVRAPVGKKSRDADMK